MTARPAKRAGKPREMGPLAMGPFIAHVVTERNVRLHRGLTDCNCSGWLFEFVAWLLPQKRRR